MRATGTLAAAAMLALAACAPRPAPIDVGPDGPRMAVEVKNHHAFPVQVKYYTTGGGPHYVGAVTAYGTATFRLPRTDVGAIIAETEDGRRISRRSHLIEFRRFEIDPVTGEEVGTR